MATQVWLLVGLLFLIDLPWEVLYWKWAGGAARALRGALRGPLYDLDSRRRYQIHDAERCRLRLAHDRLVLSVLSNGPAGPGLDPNGHPVVGLRGAVAAGLPAQGPHVVALGEVEEVAVEGLQLAADVPPELRELVAHRRDLVLPLHVEGGDHVCRLFEGLDGLGDRRLGGGYGRGGGDPVRGRRCRRNGYGCYGGASAMLAAHGSGLSLQPLQLRIGRGASTVIILNHIVI